VEVLETQEQFSVRSMPSVDRYSLRAKLALTQAFAYRISISAEMPQKYKTFHTQWRLLTLMSI
jgi:hypothetical protein